MSYNLGNTDAITYEDGNGVQDVYTLTLDGDVIWSRPLEVQFTPNINGAGGSLGIDIVFAPKDVQYFEYNIQPRHAGLTWKNPYYYELDYEFDYVQSKNFYGINVNRYDGQGFVPLYGTRYEYVSADGTSLTWEQANTAAVERGGRLASPKTYADLTKLNNYLNTVNYGVGAWIGLKRDGGDWKWVDGSVSTTFNWLGGEPNNAFNNENYVHVLPTGSSGSTSHNWNDIDNAASNGSHFGSPRFGYIIEYEETENKFYPLENETGAQTRARGWARVKTLLEAGGESIGSVIVNDRSTSGDVVFQNLPADYTASVRVWYNDETYDETDPVTISIEASEISYTATKANVHSTNPYTVAGYGCAYQADLGWSVFTRTIPGGFVSSGGYDGGGYFTQPSSQLYMAIGYFSSVHHGSANQNTLRNATHESLTAHYNTHGMHKNLISTFTENVLLPLSTENVWVYGTQDKVFGHQQNFAWHYKPIHFSASNPKWIFAARLLSGGRIEVKMSPRNGTGDQGSTMTVNAMNCAFNIAADRANGTAITPYIFNYE